MNGNGFFVNELSDLINKGIKRKDKYKGISRTFVMSDIHGEFEMLMAMLKKIEFNQNDTLYIIGDVVDRGSHPIEILEWIMETPNVHLLRGNHESMFLDYLSEKDEMRKALALHHWLPRGGYPTHLGYEKRSKVQKEEIKGFLHSLPNYKIIDNVILVHSGIDAIKTDETLSIKEIMRRQDEDTMLWSREEFFSNKGIENALILFGHTPTMLIQRALEEEESTPLEIWHDKTFHDKIGIDCGAVFNKTGGRLACICLDDMSEYYV